MQPGSPARSQPRVGDIQRFSDHFRDVLILEKLDESLVPTPWTAAMIAIAMPAAIRPYSIAVAADSSAINVRIIFMSVFVRIILYVR